MQNKYTITGHYRQEGVRGEVEGDIYVDAAGAVKGTITDKLSSCQKRAVNGRMIKQEGVIHLEMICELPDKNLLNIGYSLTKSQGAVAEGVYTGSWIPVRKELGMNVKSHFEAPNGETWFNVELFQLVPEDKDLHPQHVKLTLRKAS